MSNKLNKYENLLDSSVVQKEMHLPTGNPGDLNDKNNVLYSVHQRGKHKTLWYKSSWESMTDQNVPTNPEHVTYRSKIYPNIPKKDTDTYIVTQGGDRLDTLAYQFYKDSSLWWIIATANNIHSSDFAVDDGTILRIPKDYISILNKTQE